MPTKTPLVPDNAYVHTQVAQVVALEVLACAYCRTPRASRYETCRNCGAHEVNVVQPLIDQPLPKTPPSMPTPIATISWR